MVCLLRTLVRRVMFEDVRGLLFRRWLRGTALYRDGHIFEAETPIALAMIPSAFGYLKRKALAMQVSSL